MPDDDKFSASFDPRTWGTPPAEGGSTKAPSPRPAEPDSFDPKTWTAVPDRAAGEPAAAPPQPGRRYGRAALAAALILATGAGAALLTRTEPPPDASAAEAPVEAEAGPPDSRRTMQLAEAGQIAAALADAGIDAAVADQVQARALALLADADGVRLDFAVAQGNGGVRLAWLEATRTDGSGLRITAGADGALRAERLAARLTIEPYPVAGEMDGNSFYTSAVASGVNDSLISDFAGAFGFELDFQREVRRGDRFEAVIEQARNPAGEAVGPPRLLFVSIRTAEKSLRFYRFRPPGGEAGWFDDNGRSNVRAFMRTPVDGARVTSGFGMRRHPILGYQRLHRGTDFAAPTGTSVFASADAEVEVAAPRGAAGNMIRLRHDNGWLTHYFHLSAFAPDVSPGARVRQGQLIGLVGTTGRSTGPHLHYEVFIDGEPVDPLTIDTGTGTTLSGAALAAFNAERDRIDRMRR